MDWYRGAVEVNIENTKFIVVSSRCRDNFKVGNFMYVATWLTTSKNSSKVRAARAARLFFLIQPIRSSFSRVVVVVVLT